MIYDKSWLLQILFTIFSNMKFKHMEQHRSKRSQLKQAIHKTVISNFKQLGTNVGHKIEENNLKHSQFWMFNFTQIHLTLISLFNFATFEIWDSPSSKMARKRMQTFDFLRQKCSNHNTSIPHFGQAKVFYRYCSSFPCLWRKNRTPTAVRSRLPDTMAMTTAPVDSTELDRLSWRPAQLGSVFGCDGDDVQINVTLVSDADNVSWKWRIITV